MGQAALPQERLSDRAHRSSRRRHGAQGRRRQDASRRAARSAFCRSPSIRSSASTCSRRAKSASCWPTKGWNRVVAFQTRNPLHRAHEYALVYGLETLLARRAQRRRVPQSADRRNQGRRRQRRRPHAHLRGADRARERWAKATATRALWGPRQEPVPDRVILLGLDIKMFYGGPKEAIMHGIYRQNYGFTDIVIGRKHADAPYHDGTADLGRFRRPGDLRQARGRSEDPAAQGRLRRLLRIGRPRRPDGEPQGRKAGVHLRQGRAQDAAAKARRSTRASCARARRRFWPPRWWPSSGAPVAGEMGQPWPTTSTATSRCSLPPSRARSRCSGRSSACSATSTRRASVT